MLSRVAKTPKTAMKDTPVKLKPPCTCVKRNHLSFCFFPSSIAFSWRVPNPPGANPLVAERAPGRSSGQQPIRNPYRFLSFLLHTWQPLCDPNSHSWGRARKALSATRGLAPGGLGTRQFSASKLDTYPSKNKKKKNAKKTNGSTLIFFSLPFWIFLPFSFSRNSLRF